MSPGFNSLPLERRNDDPWRTEIADRMQTMELQHYALRDAVTANTIITMEIKKNTDDIVAFFEAGRGTFKFLSVIGTAAKWITTVSAALVLIYMMWKGTK